VVSLEELIWEGIARQREYVGVHAGHFDYKCKRYAFYKLRFPEAFNIANRKQKLRFWVGEALHDKRILPEDKNFPFDKMVQYRKCYFTPDEYYCGPLSNGLGVLLEKKSVRNWASLGRNFPNPEHVKRCEHYRMAMVLNEYSCSIIALLYIDYIALRLFMFSTSDGSLSLRAVSETKQTFDLLMDDFELSMDKNILPPRHITWLCDFCPAFTECFKVSGRNE